MGWITIRQLALICLWAFFFLPFFFPRRVRLLLRVSLLFVRLLVCGVCPLLLISSALISHFIAAEGAQNVCCCSAHTYFGISRLPGQSNHVNEIKVQELSPSSQTTETHTRAHTRWEIIRYRKNSQDRDVLLSSQHDHFILPPLHPSHRSICLSSPLFPFLVPSLHSSLPPSASHYLLLLSLLSSRSSTSLVPSNFPCPRCFLFLFFPPPPPSSLSFRVLILSFTSTPLSPPNLHHSPSHHSLPRTLSVRSLSSWVACLCAFVLRTLLSHRSFFTLTLPSASMTHLSFIRYPSSPSPPLSLYPWTSCQCVWPFSDVYPFARFLQKAAVWPLAEFWKRNQKTLQVLYLDIRSYTYVRVLLPYVA